MFEDTTEEFRSHK